MSIAFSTPLCLRIYSSQTHNNKLKLQQNGLANVGIFDRFPVNILFNSSRIMRCRLIIT